MAVWDNIAIKWSVIAQLLTIKVFAKVVSSFGGLHYKNRKSISYQYSSSQSILKNGLYKEKIRQTHLKKRIK